MNKNNGRSLSMSALVMASCFVGSANADLIDDLKVGHWLEVPGTNMSKVYATPSPPGNSGQSSVMDAWNGGIFDTKRNRLVVWGGGHVDYAGNELYAFDINTMTWKMISEPSSPAPICVQYYPDGGPSARHTYNMLQYSPLTDSFLVSGGSGYSTETSECNKDMNFQATDYFDFTTSSWKIGSNQPDSIGSTIGRMTALDTGTGHIWAIGGYDSTLNEYDPLNDVWTTRTSPDYLEIDASAAIDPKRRLMVTVGGWVDGSSKIMVWDLKMQQIVGVVPTTSGDNTLEVKGQIGFIFDPIIDKFVGWDDGASLYTLDPDTWVWTKVNAAASNTISPVKNGNGTWGRFRYIPSRNVYILVNSTTGNVYFYKMSPSTPLVIPSTPTGAKATTTTSK